MASKGPEAFRTISEVAEELDLPQHVLRFWETRFTQIRPMKRGGGRRYYRPDDVDLLRGIRHLLYGEGYTIRGVQRILKEQGRVSSSRPGAATCRGLARSRTPDDDRDRGRSTRSRLDADDCEDDEAINGDDARATAAPSSRRFDPREFRARASRGRRQRGGRAASRAGLIATTTSAGFRRRSPISSN